VIEDTFIEFDGAYVLGALSTADRTAFEEHLITCVDCRGRVAELRDMPALLALVGPQAFQDEPEAASDPVVVLLKTVRARRRRSRVLTAVAAAAVAACLVTLTAFIARDQTSKPATPARPVAMAALVAAPIHATAQVTNLLWGTSIVLNCTYNESSGYPLGEYTLTVQGRDGRMDTLGTWNVVPGRVTTFRAGTALHVADIKTITIATASGTPVLQLKY
jgi:hypothetical protein